MAESHYNSDFTISWDEALSSFGKDGRRCFVLYYPMWGVGELMSVIGDDCVLDFKAVGKLNEKRKVAWIREACIPLAFWMPVGRGLFRFIFLSPIQVSG